MSGFQDRDPFKIIENGEQIRAFDDLVSINTGHDPLEALAALNLLPDEGDATCVEELERGLKICERKFSWGTRGVGVFSGESVAEGQFWNYYLRKLSSELQSQDGGSICSLTVPQMFNPSILMPKISEQTSIDLHEAGFALRTGVSDLAKAVQSVTSQTRPVETEPLSFIVSMPEISDHIMPLLQFETALTAGNKSAVRLRTTDAQEQRTYFATDTEPGQRHVQDLQRRLRLFIDNIISNEAPENIPGMLRRTGEQVSSDLALGLEYLYYHRLVNFIDAGSSYRTVPENVRIGLIVDGPVYDTLLARGLHNPYATVKRWDPEANLGCYATIPYSEKHHSQVLDSKFGHMQNFEWQHDPLTQSLTAALLFADSELSRLPAEDFRIK